MVVLGALLLSLSSSSVLATIIANSLSAMLGD
jgi:hypothetical protein